MQISLYTIKTLMYVLSLKPDLTKTKFYVSYAT